jgi:hypothetical protein
MSYDDWDSATLGELRDLLLEIRDMMQTAMTHVIDEAVAEEAEELNKTPRES